MSNIDAANTLETGGYVILRKEKEFLAFWSNPQEDEWEKNQGLFKKNITRCDGDSYTYSFYQNQRIDFLAALEDNWKVWRRYAYHYDLEDLPEGFEDAAYLTPHGKGYKAFNTSGELVCLVPEVSGTHLFFVCGIPIEYRENNA
jgi:hypothetical protein